MTEILVRKLDAAGRERWRYPGRVLAVDEKRLLLEAVFDLEVEICGVRIRRGDRSLEAFFSDRWYNLFAIYAPEGGALKGYYVNIGRPAVWDEATVSYEDLALDLWVQPDGTMCLLDEEEFAALSLPPADRAQAEAALREVQRRFVAIAAEAFALPPD